MENVRNHLASTKHTTVWVEPKENWEFGAPHFFEVCPTQEPLVINEFPIPRFATVYFQRGPVKENGVNGIHNEDLIVIVIERLRAFQAGPYACRENAIALTKLEESLMWLRSRTLERESRGVEGTHVE